jgi:hypothetical protein
MGITHPPPIKSYGITHTTRLRFVTNATVLTAITYQNLLDIVLVGQLATTLVDLFYGVRINSIEMWSLPAIGAASTVTLIYSGATVGASGDQKTHTDTSMGIEPAHVKARPDPRTQAGQFQPSSTAVAFTISAPTGTVLDVSLTFRNPIEGSATAAQNAGVAVTISALYYRGLDGKAAAATSYPNVGALAVV